MKKILQDREDLKKDALHPSCSGRAIYMQRAKKAHWIASRSLRHTIVNLINLHSNSDAV